MQFTGGAIAGQNSFLRHGLISCRTLIESTTELMEDGSATPSPRLQILSHVALNQVSIQLFSHTEGQRQVSNIMLTLKAAHCNIQLWAAWQLAQILNSLMDVGNHQPLC